MYQRDSNSKPQINDLIYTEKCRTSHNLINDIISHFYLNILRFLIEWRLNFKKRSKWFQKKLKTVRQTSFLGQDYFEKKRSKIFSPLS